MPKSVLQTMAASAIVLIFCVILYFSYHWLPWTGPFHTGDAVDTVDLWTGFVVLLMAEFAVLHTGRSRFRFRMAAQLPLLVHFGVFPVLIMQGLLLIVKQAYEVIQTRTIAPHYPRFLKAIAVPLLSGMAYMSVQSIGSSMHVHILAIACAMSVFWFATALLQLVPGRRSVVHPWRPVAGWSIFLLFLDAAMACGAIVQQAIGGPWSELVVTFELITIIASLGLYTDSSIRRSQLVHLTNLVSELSADTDWMHLIEHLFAGLGRMVVADVVALWLVRSDGRLYPHFIHAYDSSMPASVLNQALSEGKEIGQAFGMGLIGFAASSRDVIRVQSPRQRQLFQRDELCALSPSALATPIVMDGEVMAVLSLHHTTALSAYASREQELFRVFSQQLGSIFTMLWRYEQSKLRAEVDELTGLYNYRYFDHALHQCVADSDTTNMPLTLLLIDLDHFKSINDHFGHLAGNQVLVKLAKTLKEMVRNDDIVARYGGEEFTILLPGLSTAEGEVIAERIRRRVEEMTFEVEPLLQDSARSLPPSQSQSRSSSRHRMIKLTLSIGVATYPDISDSPLTLMRHADRAMYIGSKQSGRNRVSTYI